VTKKMPFDDLNLEFEDEEEALKKKKAETLQVDVDLEFQAPESVARSRPAARPSPQGGEPAARPAPPSSPGAQVRKIDEARAAAAAPNPSPARRPVPQSIPREATAPRALPTQMVSGSSALETNYDFESESVVQMREEMRRVQIESEVKVGVAEFKTEFLSEMLSDMKLLDHQINQLLVRINAKHPDMKQEVLMIKKLLADFNAKKRK
jgi:hypothetical protein